MTYTGTPPQSPQQQWGAPPSAPAKKEKKRHIARWIAGGVAIIVIIAIAASAGSKKKPAPQSSPVVAPPAGSASSAAPASPSISPSTTASKAGIHHIGETATTSGWEVTVYGLKDPWTSTNQFDTPRAGNRYVEVDVQVRNTKSSQQLFSSLASFKLFDSANRAYDEAITVDQPGPPEGEIPGGQAVRGFVTFQVPTTATGLTFQVQGSFTASGSRFSLAP
jgi:hypothetical protein